MRLPGDKASVAEHASLAGGHNAQKHKAELNKSRTQVRNMFAEPL